MNNTFNPIKTADQLISVKGKVFYNDQRRRIDLKKPIRDLFESKSADVHYVMELCLNQNKVIERVKELTKQGVLPVILYFTLEGDKNG